MPARLARVRAPSLARLLRALVGSGLAWRLGLVPFATPVDHLLRAARCVAKGAALNGTLGLHKSPSTHGALAPRGYQVQVPVVQLLGAP
jgi:hypothetical protein